MKKLGILLVLVISAALASTPSVQAIPVNCIGGCYNTFNYCYASCGEDLECRNACRDNLEFCNCYYCNYCP